MPYIPNEDRAELEGNYLPKRVGELNYVITRIIDSFLARSRVSPSYEQINSIIGVLECAKLELYRRIGVPYEDHKREINGDVYTIAKD